MSHHEASSRSVALAGDHSVRRIGCLVALALAAVLRTTPVFAKPTASAQPPPSASTSSVEPAAQRPRQLIAINPVFIAFGTLTGEYEFGITRHLSLGASVWYEYRDVRARWMYAKVLFNPWGEAPSGFSLGPTLGVLTAYREPGESNQLSQDTAATVGAMAQYTHLFCPDELCLIGAGIGGRTPLVLSIPDASPLERLDGDVRLVAGVAF